MKLNEITKEALIRMPKSELASIAEDLFSTEIPIDFVCRDFLFSFAWK